MSLPFPPSLQAQHEKLADSTPYWSKEGDGRQVGQSPPNDLEQRQGVYLSLVPCLSFLCVSQVFAPRSGVRANRQSCNA